VASRLRESDSRIAANQTVAPSIDVAKSSEDRTYQDGVNQSQWEDPSNWWLGLLYHSQRDDRVWVPKRLPSFGVTINLGRSLGLAIALAIPFLIIGFIVTAALGR
jgi:uncharacterized membrane protein